MKHRKMLALLLASAMTMSLIACGNSTQEAATAETTQEKTETATETTQATGEAGEEVAGVPSYSQIEVGTDYLDYTATIKWTTHRTDRGEDGTLAALITEFNKVYPNITVEVEAIPDFAEEALLRLSSGDYADIMAIPAIDKAEYSTPKPPRQAAP